MIPVEIIDAKLTEVYMDDTEGMDAFEIYTILNDLLLNMRYDERLKFISKVNGIRYVVHDGESAYVMVSDGRTSRYNPSVYADSYTNRADFVSVLMRRYTAIKRNDSEACLNDLD